MENPRFPGSVPLVIRDDLLYLDIPTLANETVRGNKLKDAVGRRMQDVIVNHMTPGTPKHSVISTMLCHFDELPGTLWSQPRSKAEINAVVPSAYSAFHHAYGFKTDTYLYEASLQTPADYENAWQDVFNWRDRSLYFDGYFWKPPISFVPGRVPPFYFVIREYYERHKEDLAVVDFGAGTGYFSTLLNKPQARILLGESSGKDTLERKFSACDDLPIVCRVNVDKDPEIKLYNWARFNTDDAQKADLLGELFMESFHGATNLMLDITNFEHAAGQIQMAIHDRAFDEGANVAISSFSRYQFKPRSPEETEYLQYDFLNLVNTTLREGGIWIDVGEEMLGNDLKQQYKVQVYEKKGKLLVPKGIPFTIADDGTVLNIDLDYFNPN